MKLRQEDFFNHEYLGVLKETAGVLTRRDTKVWSQDEW
jgi:hypothetical protein